MTRSSADVEVGGGDSGEEETTTKEESEPCLLQTDTKERQRGQLGGRRACEGRGSMRGGGSRLNLDRISTVRLGALFPLTRPIQLPTGA
jgi:hypothetical protein